MSNVTKIALSAAIILSAALSAITEQARNAASSGVAAYTRDGSVVEGHWYNIHTPPNH